MASLSSIADTIAAFKRGEMVVVMDDESRENEGDLIIAASAMTPAKTAFILRHTTGILCVALSGDMAERLELDPMVGRRGNTDPKGTAFTVTCDVVKGITTGASAFDRCMTCMSLADPKAVPEDFTRPGHVFPLIAKPRGVLERRGHTEAAVDLCALAGMSPAGAICAFRGGGGLSDVCVCCCLSYVSCMCPACVLRASCVRPACARCACAVRCASHSRFLIELVIPPLRAPPPPPSSPS